MRTELPVERLHRRLGARPSAAVDGPDVDALDESVADLDSDDADGTESGGDASLSRWLPDRPNGDTSGWWGTVRTDPGRAGALALAAVAAIAILVTVFTLIRDTTPPVVSAKLPPVQMVSSANTSPGPAPSAAPDQPVVVSVVGLVHKPGLVTLTPGARIADAVSAAGGTLDGADVIGLNMARRVADGEQIVVGIAPAPGEPAVLGSSITSDPASAHPDVPAGAAEPGTAGPQPPVNLNTATADQLDELPGVGPVTATAIISWRDANGPFTSVEQLAEVDGIGPARLDKLRELVHA